MTKGDKMVRSFIRWQQRQSQLTRRNCIKITKNGLTLMFRRPADPQKVKEAEEYLRNVIDTLHEEAEKHVRTVLTTGYGVMEV